MRHTKVITLSLLTAVALGVSGCAWGPCGPVFTQNSGFKDEEKKINLKKAADAVKDAPPVPQAPTVAVAHL